MKTLTSMDMDDTRKSHDALQLYLLTRLLKLFFELDPFSFLGIFCMYKGALISYLDND